MTDAWHYALPARTPLPPRRMDPNTEAWFKHLDVDLEAAQAALRLPIAERGWPAGAEAATELPGPGSREPEVVHRAPEGQQLRGAYARRLRAVPDPPD